METEREMGGRGREGESDRKKGLGKEGEGERKREAAQ